MSLPFQPGYAAYTQGFGTAPAGVSFPIYVNAAPTSSFIQGPLGIFQPGQRAVWINTAVYELLGFTSVAGVLSANWVEIASSSGDVLAVVGTANQITSTTVAGTATLSLPAALIAPGSVTTNGNLTLGAAGNKINITTGANASAGTTAALTAGTIVVANTSITANSLVFFTTNALGTVTAAQAYYVSARTPGTSFTVTSASATDTSTVNYLIIN